MYIDQTPIPAGCVVFSEPIGSFDLQETPLMLMRVLAACSHGPEQKRSESVSCFCQWNNYKTFLPDLRENSYKLGDSPELREPFLRVSFYLGLKQTAIHADLDALQASWNTECPSPCLVICPALQEPLLQLKPSPRSADGCDGSPFRIMSYALRVTLDWQDQDEGRLVFSLGKLQDMSKEELNRAQNLVKSALEKGKDEPSHLTTNQFLSKTNSALLPELNVTGFAAGVDSLQDDMRKGVCYLANLTITQDIPKDLLSQSAQQFLRSWLGRTEGRLQPSRFGWYIHTEDFHLESFSPERFIRRDGDIILTEPIKGTALVPQTQTDIQHNQNAAQHPSHTFVEPELETAQILWSSCKERAEQHLVTDLLRNDLSQICRPGTVTVCTPFEVRIDSGLAQMCTTIWGLAEHNQTLPLTLSKILPAGSVTGTPKLQVCHALRRLEPRVRGYYTGLCIDFIEETRFDATLLIRSIFSESEKCAYAGAGGGITILSRADLETAEVQDKWRSFLLRCSR